MVIDLKGQFISKANKGVFAVEPLVLTSKNNRVRVEFASDASVERDGFFLAFYADEDECASENNAGCEQICHNRWDLGGSF